MALLRYLKQKSDLPVDKGKLSKAIPLLNKSFSSVRLLVFSIVLERKLFFNMPKQCVAAG